jgi:hypothetical protein
MNAKTLIVLVLVSGGCSSQPRFTPHGENVNLMFDNKTAQNCWAGPRGDDMDDAVAHLQSEQDRLHTQNLVDCAITPACAEAQKRVDYLKEHPEQQKMHNGLPYCSELK